MDIAAFEQKYIPEPMSGCFLWTGAQHRQGYGSISVRGKTQLAHRISWQFYCGEIPDGIKVLHKCDNPPCVNPDHLFLGTQSDNMSDCGKKGRANKKGENNGRSILTRADAVAIRCAPQTYGVRVKLARRFGVTVSAVAQIRSKRTWNTD
jgi:HNH endonuclease